MMHGNWRTHWQRATTTTTTCNNDAMPLPMPTSPETIDNVRNKTRKATSIKRMSNQHKYWHMVTRTQMAGNAICSKQNKHIMHSCTMAHPSWSFDDNDQNHFWICISNCHHMCKCFVWNLNCFDVSNKLNSGTAAIHACCVVRFRGATNNFSDFQPPVPAPVDFVGHSNTISGHSIHVSVSVFLFQMIWIRSRFSCFDLYYWWTLCCTWLGLAHVVLWSEGRGL